MPKQTTYTIEEARARAAEVGDEWTPELEAKLRAAGKIRATPMDPAAPLPRNAVSALGPNIDPITRESTLPPWFTQVDQQAIGSRIPVAAAGSMLFGTAQDAFQMEPPESRSARAADVFGSAMGTGADFALMAPLAGAAVPGQVVGATAKALQAARVPAAIAARVAPGVATSPLMFGGHTALSGGSPGEVARSAAEGVAFGALGAIPGLRTIMQNQVGHEAVNVEALAAMNMLEGMSPAEAHAAAIPTALGLKVGGVVAGPRMGLGRDAPVGSWDRVERYRNFEQMQREATLRALQEQQVAAERAAAEARARELTEQPPLVEPQPFWRSPVETGSMDPADVARRVREAAAEDRARLEAQQPPVEALTESGQGGLMPSGTTMPVRYPPAVLPPEGRMAAEAPRSPSAGLSPEVVRRAVEGADLPAEANLALPPGGSTGAPSAGVQESSPILTSGGRRQYVSPLKGEGGAPLYTEDVPTVPRRASAREPFNRGEAVTGTIKVGPDGQAVLPQQQLTPRRGRQPLPTRRGDVQLGSGLGGGGEAWKFRELRQALGDLGKRLVDADARLAEKLAPLYRPGMSDSDFLAQREVRSQMLGAKNMADVLEATKAIATGMPQPPTPGGPAGAPTRPSAPTSGGGGSMADLQESARQPRRGSRLSEGVNEFLNDGESFREMAGRLRESAPTVDKKRLKEIRKQLSDERSAAAAAAKEAGEEAPQYPRSVKDEADYQALREQLPPDLVAFVDAQAARREGGEKTPLDVGYYRSQRHAQEYLYQGMGGGATGDANPLDTPLIRNVHDSRRVGYKWHDNTLAQADAILKRNKIKVGSPEDAAIEKLIEGAKGGSIADFAQTAEGQAILSGVKGRDGAIRAAEEIVTLLEDVRLDRNALTDVYGETPISKREGFAPKYEGRPAWWDLFGKIKRAYEGPEAGQTVAPSLESPDKAKKFDPHSRRRTQDDSRRQWSIVRGLHRYIGEEAAVISGTMGLHNNYEIARFLELSGFDSAAKVIRAYSQSDFNKRGWGIGGALDRTFNEGGLTGVLGAGMKWNYDRLADAVFTLNLGWNMIVQPSSAVFVYAAGGNKAAAQGLLGARDPEFRKFVDQNVFSRQVKSRRGGSVGDIGQEASAEGSVDTGITKMKHKAQTLNQVIEREIDMYAAYVGMKQGEAMGLKGRELIDFMSDSIKKTQDVYNRQDRPELVRSKMFNVAVPFSGFGFNMASNLQEQGAIPFATRVGTYQARGTRGARAGYAIRLAVGAAAANAIAGMLAGREELYGPSSLPMFDILTGSGFGEGKLGPALVYQNDLKVWNDAKDGKYGEAVARALKQRVPAARALANIIQAESFANGEGPFVLPEDQMVHAIVLGVWATPAGRAYIDRLKGKGGGGADVSAAPKYPVVAPAGPVGGSVPTVGRGGVPIPARR